MNFYLETWFIKISAFDININFLSFDFYVLSLLTGETVLPLIVFINSSIIPLFLCSIIRLIKNLQNIYIDDNLIFTKNFQ